MGTSHGSTAQFMGNGYDLSTFLKSAGPSASREASDASTFGVLSKKYVAGLKDVTMSLEGVFDGVLDAIDDVMKAALDSNVDGLFSYFPFGQLVQGNLAYSMDTTHTSYEISTDVGDVAQITAEVATGNAGRFTRGLVARPYAVAAAGGNTTGLDAGAGFGATNPNSSVSLVVHATASASLNVKLQHSTDNISFTDVGTALVFSTGRGSQRLVLSSMTLNRYTRVLWTGTGTFMAIIER
jgi:hypothetical protein